MADFKTRLENTFKVPRNILSLLGCFPTESGEYNVMYLNLVLIFTFESVAITFYSMYFDWPDLAKVAINASPFLAASSGLIKYWNYRIYRKEFFIYIKTIREEFWEKNKSNSEDEKEIIENYSQYALKLNILQTALILLSWPLWLIKPFLEMYVLEPEDPNIPVGRILPFKIWLPFHLDIYADPTYQIIFLLESIGSFLTALILSSMESLFVFLTLSTCAQFKLVQKRIREFDKNQEQNFVLQEKCIYECVEFLQKLYKLCNDLELIVTTILVSLFTICALFFCICGFTITLFPGNAYIYMQNIICVSAAMTDLFLLCFIGDLLTTESSAVAKEAYSCNWYNSNSNVKKCIQVIIMRAQSPIYLTAWKLTPASLESFEMVTRTAVSYFTVLSSITEEEN